RGARREHLRVGWAEVQDAPASGNPETATEQRLEQERVRAAIAELPPEQREVLALAYFQGYTHREIAGVLGLPLGTIKTRIRLAMQKLRRALSENRDSPPKGEI
ncbi:MAG TPA: sigma-70 family RNA polymerase sigma factor, partial [Chloroflexi bacterium]|nr:sigma-70 family RNA polymerase sigma factor [Chloroflexota bacterium]